MSFVAFVAVVLSVSSLYVATRFIATYEWAASHPFLVALGFIGFIALQIGAPMLYRRRPERVEAVRALSWSAYFLLGLFGCLVIYTMAADLLLIAWWLLDLPGDAHSWAQPAAGVLALASGVIGWLQVASGPRVYEVDVPLAGLPQALEGFRIAQVSDLHLGTTIGRSYAERVVERVNATSPDVIALTGDFADGIVDALRDAAEPLSRLKAADGTFFITGNHEYYWGLEQWLAHYRSLGIRVLLNEHAVVRRGEARIVIAGVTDSKPDWKAAAAGAPASSTKVLLAHHPVGLEQAMSAGFQLQLSGHTHGGQFFPFSLIVRLFHRRYKGLYRVGSLWLYVNRGTGYWGPPIRFGVPAEITLIRLRAS